jgi:hypothetical protein
MSVSKAFRSLHRCNALSGSLSLQFGEMMTKQEVDLFGQMEIF